VTVLLDVEPIRPAEGEVTAAKRLLERLCRSHGRFFDAVVADSIYLQAPFIHSCLALGKHVVAVLKDNNPALLQDARGVFQLVEPIKWEQPGKVIRAWDAEGFTTNDQIRQPVRVVRAQETTTRRLRTAGQWHSRTDVADWWWCTTIPNKHLRTAQLVAVGHRRWDIENKAFNVLVNDWSMDHCFKHDPVAIINFVLTLFIAFVLVQSFYKRNLRPQLRAILTSLVSLTAELHASLAGHPCQAPWLYRPAAAPP